MSGAGTVGAAVLAGIAFMVVGTSLFPVMNAIAKSLAGEFPLWQVTWARFLGHLLLMTAILCPRHGLGVFASARPGLQLVRSTVFFGSNVTFIGALPHVSLATAAAIMFTVPVIVTALSVLFLGERVGLWRWGAVACGFLGALVIIRPGSTAFEPGTLLVLGSALCYSTYQLLTRRLAAHDSAQTQILWTAVVGAVSMCLVVPFVGRMPDDALQIGQFVALGTIGAVAHLLVIQALRRAPASVIAPIGYVELVGATVLGFVVFGDLPGPTTWLGAALIVASGLVIAYREGLARRAGRGTPVRRRYGPEAMIAVGVGLMLASLLAHLLG
ncbi:MAG: DMT family transporter [Ectothiorhodospiraceae bacterium]|nr:DMT family transporter [Ectothiorhodospiraceae bacterium]